MSRTRQATPALLLAAALLALAGCDNVQTPQGHVTYLYKDGRLYRGASLEGAQLGPTSTGWVWEMSAITFKYTPENHPEQFEILVKDDINVSFDANAIISIKTDKDSVREIVEGWGLDFYDNLVQEAFRSITRRVVGSYNHREIREERTAISTRIKAELEQKLEDYEKQLMLLNGEVYKKVPITIQSVNVDNLDYPQELQTVISRTRELAKLLEQKSTELEIAAKDKERRIAQAKSKATRIQTVAGTLDDEYITNYAIEVAKRIADAGCPTVVIIPMDPTAPGVPFVAPGTEPEPKRPEPPATTPDTPGAAPAPPPPSTPGTAPPPR